MSMTLPHNGVGRAVRVAEAALWTGAAVFVLSAHVGVVAWLMREQPIVAADDAPPAAIMIEFAEEAEAINTEENEITPDEQSAEASAPAEQVESPEEAPPEEVVETPPEPVEQEVTEAEPEEPIEEEIVEEIDEPIEEDVVQLPDVDVPLPTARPKPPEPRKVPPKREAVKQEDPKKPEPRRQKPRPQQQQVASQATRQAQAQVREGARTAARQSASGVSSMTPARWQSRLMAHLERRKRYPADARRRGETGTAYVRFTIDDGGNVGSVSLARSSGYPALDNEVLALVRRASPVPAPPPGVNRTITAPVRFSTR